jgi:hypothetical protein
MRNGKRARRRTAAEIISLLVERWSLMEAGIWPDEIRLDA